MDWTVDQGIDVTGAFIGITTPLRELFDEVHQRGWDVTKVNIKDGQYVATVKNPHGETIEKVGPDPQTAVGHCLVALMRQETIRYRQAAWDRTWEDKLAEIAQGYADANAYDPKAASAWKELAQDSEARAKAIANQIRIELTHDPHPYQDVNEMADDIRNKKKIQISRANTSHPLWTEDQVLAHRLVQDVLGHAQVGGDWGWHGTNGAVAAVMPLLSPQAQRALFTEVIGQTAYNHFYRDVGPQKIVFLDDHFQNVQDAEGAAGHGGVHPSQTIIPVGIPEISEEGDEEGGGKTASKVGGNPPGHTFFHGSNYDFQPGDVVTPMSSRGSREDSEWADAKLYNPDHVYLWSANDNGYSEVGGSFGRYQYEVEPLGDVQPDPERELGTDAHIYDPAAYSWITTQARVIRKLDPQEQRDVQMGIFKRSSVAKVDPNHGWASGIEPLPDNAYLWQREESGLDPLDHAGVKDMAHKVHPNWFELHDHDGMPDLDSQRQAVTNAFRSVLLQPRQTPRWGATHYQHVQHILATVSDPLRFSDTLNAQRAAHNKARGLPGDIHEAQWSDELMAMMGWMKSANPQLDDSQIRETARRELFHMIAEEEERVTRDDPGGQLLPMQIREEVNKALKKRLSVATKPSIDQKIDFGKERLFHKGFNSPDPGIYGDFLNTHVRSVAGVGLHADDLARAAREDVANHGGQGHHFRAKTSDLIPGVGPREISHAWMMLQPHTSQLGVISPSVAETLGYDPEKEIPPRDFYKMERQLAAGRDAAGYTHVPLGQFSWGMHDRANYGHGKHRDLSPFAAVNPTPYDQVDWTQYPSLPTQDWDDPYWWKSTEPNRDEVGRQYDQMIAVKYPKHEIPYRTAGMTGPQKQRALEEIDAMHPDTSDVVHEFPNGYTIRKLNTWGDKRREGRLMHNCWANPLETEPGPLRDEDPISMPIPVDHYSLRDEQNYPHASFFFEPTLEAGPMLTGMGKGFYGHGNAEVSLQYQQMIKEWAKQKNVHINPNEWRGYREASAPDEDFVPTQPDLTNGDWKLPASANGILHTPFIMHPDSGEMIIGEPTQSAMQHAKNTLGLTTEQIWAMDPEVGKQ